MTNLTLSALLHTWILDLDGTIVEHNGYLKPTGDRLLDGAKDFMSSIPTDDMVLFLTSRTEDYKKQTERFLQNNGIRYDMIVYNVPFGERILINDNKPSGLQCAYAFGKERDASLNIKIQVDNSL
jgi:hypothetical protein